MKKHTLTNYFAWAGSAFIALLSVGVLTSVYAGPERIDSKSSKEMPAVTEPCNWTGLYGGLHVGFGGGKVYWRDDDFGDNEILTNPTPTGVFGGAQLGYNRQFGNWLVLGIESEFEASDVSADQTVPHGDETEKYHVRNNWNGTVGARVGVTSFNNRLLAYAKGGVSFERWEYDWLEFEPTVTNKFGDSEWRVAPIVGFGLEYALNCRWSMNVEYKHLFLGDKEMSANRVDGGVNELESYRYDLSQDSVQVGVNYKFWRF
jgi:opacity protein-like surface antigen